MGDPQSKALKNRIAKQIVYTNDPTDVFRKPIPGVDRQIVYRPQSQMNDYVVEELNDNNISELPSGGKKVMDMTTREQIEEMDRLKAMSPVKLNDYELRRANALALEFKNVMDSEGPNGLIGTTRDTPQSIEDNTRKAMVRYLNTYRDRLTDNMKAIILQELKNKQVMMPAWTIEEDYVGE